MSNRASNVQVGAYGSTHINDTAANTLAAPGWGAILSLDDTTAFTLLTDEGRDGDALGAITIPAGVTIFGTEITAITLAAGAVIAYKNPPAESL